MTEYVRSPETYEELLVPATDGDVAISSFLSQWGGSSGFNSPQTYFNADGTVGFLEVTLFNPYTNYSFRILSGEYLVVRKRPEGGAAGLFTLQTSLAHAFGYEEL